MMSYLEELKKTMFDRALKRQPVHTRSALVTKQ